MTIITQFKESILALLNELLLLFEDKKSIYKRLLMIRHRVRNEYDDTIMFNICTEFYQKNNAALSHRDVTVFYKTRFGDDVETIWTELSVANRLKVWEWIDRISNVIS